MVPVAGRTMLDWSVSAAAAACDGVTLVLPAGLLEQAVPSAETALAQSPVLGEELRAGQTTSVVPADTTLADVALRAEVVLARADAVVAGGATRSASVRAGLGTVPDDVDVVVCHDAARPGASAALFDAVIAAVRSGADAAVPVLPVYDTLKRVPAWRDSGGTVTATVDRTGLFAVQTPQAFRREALVAAHAGAPEATDDAALIEAAGGTVLAVPGEAEAHKVTTQADLVIVEALLAGRARAVATHQTSPTDGGSG